MTPLRLLLLALLVAFAACTTSDDSDQGIDFNTCGVRPHAILPLTFKGNVPVVQATIKGTPATLVLDTGAQQMMLTETALHRLDLPTDAKRVTTSRGVGGETTSFSGILQDFQIAGMRVPDHPVSVLPSASVVPIQKIADGLFGADVLSNFEVDLDLPRRQITLYAGRLCPTTVLPPWTVPYETVDASRSTSRRFIIPVELDGHVLYALLDTGAAASVIFADVAQSLGVTRESLEQGPHARLVGVGPTAATAYVHRFQFIRIGDDTFQSPILMVTDRPEPNIDMIIGSDYLVQHHLWLSYATKRVFIERTRRPGAGGV